jgi:hypothetical protein
LRSLKKLSRALATNEFGTAPRCCRVDNNSKGRPAMGTRLQQVLIACAASSLGLFCSAAASEKPPSSALQLSAQWWQMVLTLPNSESPFFEQDGVRCISGQRGKVWFLYGNPSTEPGEPSVAYCTVPAGVALYFPIIASICVPFPGETIAENRRLCRESVDTAESLSLEIDGHDRSELIKRSRQYNPFPVTMPEDNFFDFPDFDTPAGIYLGVSDGYFAKTRLPRGEHTIHLTSSIPLDGISFDLIYVINVVAPEPVITPRE